MLATIYVYAILFLQSTTTGSNWDLRSMWSQMSALPRTVVVILFILSIYSFGVMIDRALMYSAARKQSRVFVQQVAGALKDGKLDEAIAIAERGVHFDLLFTDVIMTGSMNGRQLADEMARRRLAERHEQLDVGLRREVVIRFVLFHPYMDAPTCPGFHSLTALRKRLHPYIRTSSAARWPLSMMGFAGRLPFAYTHSMCLGWAGFCYPRSNLFCHHRVIARAIGGWISFSVLSPN